MKQNGGNLKKTVSKQIRKSLFLPEFYKKVMNSEYKILNNINTRYRKLRKKNSKLKALKNSKKSVKYKTFSTVSKQQQKEVKNALTQLNASLATKLNDSLSLGDLRILIEDEIRKRKRELKNEVSSKIYYELKGILDEMEKKLIEKAKRKFSYKYSKEKDNLLKDLKKKKESYKNQKRKQEVQRAYNKVQKNGVNIFIDNAFNRLTKKRIFRPYPFLSKLKKRKYNKLRSKLKVIENYRDKELLRRVPQSPTRLAMPTRPAPSPQSKPATTGPTEKPPRPPPPAKPGAKPKAKPTANTKPKAEAATTQSLEISDPILIKGPSPKLKSEPVANLVVDRSKVSFKNLIKQKANNFRRKREQAAKQAEPEPELEPELEKDKYYFVNQDYHYKHNDNGQVYETEFKDANIIQIINLNREFIWVKNMLLNKEGYIPRTNIGQQLTDYELKILKPKLLELHKLLDRR